MDKKTVATTILCFLILIFLIETGSVVSAFGVEPKKVEVRTVTIASKDGILIKDEDGEVVTELEVKSSSVGVRPATGEEDSSTLIPTTVNDQVGTEGAYAVFKLTSDKSWKILLKSCTLSNSENQNLDNIKIAIMEDDAKAKTGADKDAVLYEGEAVNDRCLVVVVWLDRDSSKSIVGADIVIELEVKQA